MSVSEESKYGWGPFCIFIYSSSLLIDYSLPARETTNTVLFKVERVCSYLFGLCHYYIYFVETAYFKNLTWLNLI